MITDAEKPARFRRPALVEWITVLVLLLSGAVMILMVPLGAGYDEDQHFFRVWQLADLQFITREIPAREAKFPEFYYEISYRKQPMVEPVGFDYWSQYGSVGLYDHGYHYGPLTSRSNYFPLLLLPQALAVRYLGFRADLPALWIYEAARLAGFLVYTLLTWLAVRWLPFGKWLMMVLVAAPMAVYQASTVSADSLANGVGLLFIAGCLAIEIRPKAGWKDCAELLLLSALLFMTKPNLFALAVLPFLLIPSSRFAKRGQYVLWATGTVLLFAILALGWNAVSPNAVLAASGEVNASEQIRHILANPLAFIGTLLADTWTQGLRRLGEWIGVYGYHYGTVPAFTYLFFGIGLVLALLARTEENSPSARTRITLLLVFAAAYLVTVAALYLTVTAVGEDFVYGVQGRYLIPIFPLFFLALYDLPELRRFRVGAGAVTTFAALALASFSLGIVLFYHVTCGVAYYTRGLCYQPVYKNFLPLTNSSPPLSEGTALTQGFIPSCDGMTTIKVRVNSTGAQGGLHFRLVDAQNRVLVEKEVRISDLTADTWYSIPFDPIRDSAGKAYTLNIEGMGAPAGQGPQLAYSIRPEYPAGQLLENGKPVEGDILFQAGCLAGWEKWLASNPSAKP